MSEFLKPFRCGHCKTRLVVMKTNNDSVIPVEIAEGELTLKDDCVFNSRDFVSHLKNCKKLQAEWNEKKKQFLPKINPFKKR
ncbi:MAG: hypothetical protein IPM56_16130 [Ignavibacteriales bacterium]|nr:MAG: hypothetical protein IPM56_16130 [Ignavibacteriales bacterium]